MQYKPPYTPEKLYLHHQKTKPLQTKKLKIDKHRRQMADGRWQMADGRWQMADGRWQMADGRWQMA
ncbi:hypothetical protein ABFY09_12505, partial [Marinomonas sp. 5E14-1]|uniref:hypothetical protein n=1 Tax=Marinomonas sp. 5E14-1 TaxID=3153922 RepID=UPI003267B48A